MRQLVYTLFISNNCASFHLWWKENLVKHQKVSKYYENDCRLFQICRIQWWCSVLPFFYPEIVFLSKSGPQIQKCQYKLKFATQTNSNIQNSMVLFRFSVSALQFLFEESIYHFDVTWLISQQFITENWNQWLFFLLFKKVLYDVKVSDLHLVSIHVNSPQLSMQ